MAKKYLFRGKPIEELVKLSAKEFTSLLPSKERRKMRRGYTDEEKKFMARLEKKDNVKTHCRSIIIFPNMVGKTVLIHRGNDYVRILLTEEMMGHRLGEFVMTRKRLAHSAPGVGATRSSASVSVR